MLPNCLNFCCDKLWKSVIMAVENSGNFCLLLCGHLVCVCVCACVCVCVCAFVEQLCYSSPCLNGGTCVDNYQTSTYDCTCFPKFTGTNCQTGNFRLYIALSMYLEPSMQGCEQGHTVQGQVGKVK